jgi:dual specificity phosphatase 12
MEQLEVFHKSSYKFTRRDKATRMFYLERTMDEILSKNRCFKLKLNLVGLMDWISDGDGVIPEDTMFAKHPRSPSDSLPNTPIIIPSRRIRCKMCR